MRTLPTCRTSSKRRMKTGAPGLRPRSRGACTCCTCGTTGFWKLAETREGLPGPNERICVGCRGCRRRCAAAGTCTPTSPQTACGSQYHSLPVIGGERSRRRCAASYPQQTAMTKLPPPQPQTAALGQVSGGCRPMRSVQPPPRGPLGKRS